MLVRKDDDVLFKNNEQITKLLPRNPVNIWIAPDLPPENWASCTWSLGVVERSAGGGVCPGDGLRRSRSLGC